MVTGSAADGGQPWPHYASCAKSRVRAAQLSYREMTHHEVERLAGEIGDCCGHGRLKCWRLARGWTVEDAVVAYERLAAERGEVAVTSRTWRQWEQGNVGVLRVAQLLCELFCTGPVQLGLIGDHTPSGRRPVRGLLHAAANEAQRLLRTAEPAPVTTGLLDGFEMVLRELAGTFVVGPPEPVVRQLDALRVRCADLLTGNPWPRHATRLHRIHGAACVLLATAAIDMRSFDAAASLADAGAAAARVIDQPALLGWARGTQALAGLADKHLGEAMNHIQEGLAALPRGPGAARLHTLCARIQASTGWTRSGVEAALDAARTALEQPVDEIGDQIGGEFGFDLAKCTYYGADALHRLGAGRTAPAAFAAAQQAAQEAAGRAVQMYGDQTGPVSYGSRGHAAILLARVYLNLGEVGEAGAVLHHHVLSLPEERRLPGIVDRLQRMIPGHHAAVLRRARGRDRAGSRTGGRTGGEESELAEAIADFCSRSLDVSPGISDSVSQGVLRGAP